MVHGAFSWRFLLSLVFAENRVEPFSCREFPVLTRSGGAGADAAGDAPFLGVTNCCWLVPCLRFGVELLRKEVPAIPSMVDRRVNCCGRKPFDPQ